MNFNAKTGFVGGLFGTVIMTAFRESVARALPPTAEFLAQYLGGEPSDHSVGAIALHLLYGGVSGVVFAPLLSLFDGRSAFESETTGLLCGLGYGLVLSLFGERVVLGGLLDMDLEEDESAVFHAGHAVYGLALGAWVGSRSGERRTRDDDDS